MKTEETELQSLRGKSDRSNTVIIDTIIEQRSYEQRRYCIPSVSEPLFNTNRGLFVRCRRSIDRSRGPDDSRETQWERSQRQTCMRVPLGKADFRTVCTLNEFKSEHGGEIDR